MAAGQDRMLHSPLHPAVCAAGAVCAGLWEQQGEAVGPIVMGDCPGQRWAGAWAHPVERCSRARAPQPLSIGGGGFCLFCWLGVLFFSPRPELN